MTTMFLTEAYIAIEIGFVDQNAVIDVVEAYASRQRELDDELAEILWINRKRLDELHRVGSLVRHFIEKTSPDCDFRGLVAEEFARRCFERRLHQYLAGTCTPWGVCKMVTPIESMFDFPRWLGNMYNLCDWIEPETPATDCRHLEEGIREVLDGA